MESFQVYNIRVLGLALATKGVSIQVSSLRVTTKTSEHPKSMSKLSLNQRLFQPQMSLFHGVVLIFLIGIGYGKAETKKSQQPTTKRDSGCHQVESCVVAFELLGACLGEWKGGMERGENT